MALLKHPLSGAIYRVCGEGLVEVDNNGVKGVFRYDGRYVSGELRHADPHMLLWLAGPQLPEDAAPRRQREYHTTIAGARDN
jgi:hypothetical protein